LSTEYSLLQQPRISEHFLIQILAEIRDKNLSLAYYVIHTLFPILNSSRFENVEQALYFFIGGRVSENSEEYLDCAHFFDLYVQHNREQ
jgi:hypothetical protein